MTDTANQQHPVFGTEPGRVDTPDWVADAIFYQIFPDRFAMSDALEKPGGIEPWDTEPTTYGYKGGDLLGVVHREDPSGTYRYEIHDFACVVTAGTPRAGDDADDLGWFSRDEIAALPTSPGLMDALRDFGVL